MLDKRLSTHLLLLVLCLAMPALPLRARLAEPIVPHHPVRLAAASRGDGHADVAVGVPGEDIGDAADDAGAVNVFYSGGHGIRYLYNQMWDQDDLWGDNDAETFDAFGAALAAGDFDGDGRDDLAIGVEIAGGQSIAELVAVLGGVE